MTQLAVNDVIREVSDSLSEEERLWRVLWIDPTPDIVILFLLADTPEVPVIRSLRGLMISLETRKVARVQYAVPSYMLRADDHVFESHKEARRWENALRHRDRNWALIADLVSQSNLPALYERNSRGILMRDAASKAKKDVKTIYRLLFRYWRYGMSPNALLPAYSKSGAPGESRKPKGVKRGRPRKIVVLGHDISAAGINIDDDICKKLLLGHKLFYQNKRKITLAKAYRKTLEKFFPDVVEETPTGHVGVITNYHDKPSIHQFRYVVQKHLDVLESIRSREGEHRFLLKHRGLTGTADQGLFGPGHRFEIDSTGADVYLISSYNKDWIIGRPVIYVVIDAFSRMIVGIHIGLSGPSWAEASFALYNAFTSKVAYCNRYGVEITEEQWPCEHLPLTVLADRGEFLGHAPNGLIHGLHVGVDTTATGRGDLKAIVERMFRTLNDEQIHFLPGAVIQRQKERGERDYRLDATLTLGEFNRIIINAVLEHNLCTRRDDLLSKKMLADSVKPYPIDIWRWGLKNLTGHLRREDSDLIRVHLLPGDMATVKANGIFWRNLRYSCSEAVRDNWFAKARNFGSWKINIKYDNNDPSEIYYLTETGDRKGLARCILQDAKKRYEQVRVEEIVDMLEYQRLCGITVAPGDDQKAAALQADSERVIADAVSRKKKSSTKLSNAQRLKNIRTHRANEAEINRIRDGIARKQPSATIHKLVPKRSDNLNHSDKELLEFLAETRDTTWSEDS